MCPNSGISGGACYCKEGYARWGSIGLCIPITISLCASKLPPNPRNFSSIHCNVSNLLLKLPLYVDQCAQRENEVYYLDAPARTCDDSCKNYGRYCRPIETFAVNYIRPHCACKEGYARLQNGTCVSVGDYYCYELYKPSEGKTLFTSQRKRIHSI